MFSDDIILGNSKCKLDNKRRFILPKFTYSEEDDDIIFSSDDNGILLLSNIVMLKKKVMELEKSIATVDDEKLVKMLNDRLERLYFSCLSTSKVDSQRRISIPAPIVRQYSIGDYVILQGCGDHLKMFNSDNEYNNYVKMIRQLK